MPLYEISDAQSGATIVVEGDSPPTEEEIASFFGPPQTESQQAATTARREKLSREMSTPVQPLGPPEPVRSMSMGERFGTGFGQGIASAGRGVGQAAGIVSQEEIDEAAQIDAPLLNTPSGRIGNIAGTVAAFSPLAFVPGANTAAGASAIGAGIGAVQPVPTGESRALNTVAGGVGGIAGFGAGRGISALAGRGAARGARAGVVNEAGELTPEAMARLETASQRGSDVLSPEEAARFNQFQRQEVTPTRANVTQRADDFVEQQSAVKRSGPVARAVAEQDRQILEAAERGVADIGPAAQSLPEANGRVFAAVDDVVTRVDEAIGAAYQAAREAAPTAPVVRLNRLADVLSENRGGENVSGGVISSLRGMLRNKGVAREVDINRGGAKLTGADTRALTVAEAEEIRQGLNGLFDSVTPQGRRLIRQLKDALDEDVGQAVGEDVFAEARAAKSGFQAMIERGRRNKFDKTRGGFLEDIIDNKIPEEKIIPRLTNARDDDFLKFKSFLTEDAGETGVQAWQDIKAQVLRGAIERASGTAGKGEGGQATFNGRLFANALAPLRKSKKFEQLFNADERQFIDDLIEIGKLRTPISGTQTGRGPSEIAVSELRRELVRRVPLIGERAEGIVSALGGIGAARRVLDPARGTVEALSSLRPIRAGQGIANLAGPATAPLATDQ